MPATTPRSHDLARWTRGGDRLVLHADGRLWERRPDRGRAYRPLAGTYTPASAREAAARRGYHPITAAGCGAERPVVVTSDRYLKSGEVCDKGLVLAAAPLVLYARDVFDAGELEARLERYQRRAAERRPLFADGPPDRATTVPASATAAPARPKKRPDPDDLDGGRGPRMYQCRGPRRAAADPVRDRRPVRRLPAEAPAGPAGKAREPEGRGGPEVPLVPPKPKPAPAPDDGLSLRGKVAGLKLGSKVQVLHRGRTVRPLVITECRAEGGGLVIFVRDDIPSTEVGS